MSYPNELVELPESLSLGNVQTHLLQGPNTVVLMAEREGRAGSGFSPGVVIRTYGDVAASGILEVTPESPRELLASTVAVQADSASPAGSIVATVEGLPASGLNAGGAELVLRTVDGGGSIANTVLWTHDCTATATGRDGDLLVAAGSPVVVKCGQELVGLDLATGQAVWTRTSDNYAYAAYAVPGSDAVARAGDFLIDRATGADLVLTGEFVADPVTGFVASSHFVSTGSWNDEPGLRVLDPATATSVLEISQEDIAALGTFEPLGAYDGRLWFWGPNGVDVVDLRTGEQDVAVSPSPGSGAASFSNVVTAAGQTWVLLSDFTLNGDATPTSIVRSTISGSGTPPLPGPVPIEELPPTTRN